MEWLNIHRSTVEGEAMQDASAEAVRAWLFLQAYCVGQENGGRIAGAKEWNDRKWLKQCGLSQEAVHQESGLWYWDGNDLQIEFYPLEQEAVQKAKRRGGRLGGKQKALKRKGHLTGEPEGEAVGVLQGEAEGVPLRKGREGKEKEGKERERLPGRGTLSESADVSIPTEAEVRAWAEVAIVDPDFAVQKWASVSERHGWFAKSYPDGAKLIDWRSRFKRFWEEDQTDWEARQKNRAAKNGAPGSYPDGAIPAAWKPGDQEWWWSEEIELIEKALTGALLGGQEETAERLREILKMRKENQ